MNYPLGHTAGRPNELTEQIEIVRSALTLAHSASEPGRIVPLDYSWPEPWRAKARELSDNRSERHDTPQYQLPGDELAVATS